MNFKVLTFLVTAGGAVTGLTFGAFVWTLQTWAPPAQPVLYLGMAMLLLFALAGTVWFQVTKAELQGGEGEAGAAAQISGLKRLLGLAAVVVFGVVGLGVMGLWMSPQFRARLVSYVSGERMQLESALRDPSEVVRQAACLKLFEIGVDGSETNLVGGLDPHPQTALACLKSAKDAGYNGTGRIAARLAAGWESQMLGAEDDPSRSCALTAPSSTAREMAGAHAAAGLLRCSMTADSLAVRKCCAETLNSKGSDLASVLGEPNEFPPNEGLEVFSSLVNHTFRPLGLPVEQQDVAAVLGSDTEVNRRWAVEFGCALVPDPDYRRDVAEGMLPIIEGGTCNLQEEAQLEFLDATQWVFLCDDIMESKAPTAEQAVCTAFGNSLVERAASEASARVYKATRARYLSGAADALEAPLPRGGGGGGSPATTKTDRNWRGYTLANGHNTHKNPPVGAMCIKTTYRARFGQTDRMGNPRMEAVKETVPCSQLGNPYAGMSPVEIRAAQKAKREAALQGALDKAFGKNGVPGGGGRKAQEVVNNVNNGIREGTR